MGKSSGPQASYGEFGRPAPDQPRNQLAEKMGAPGSGSTGALDLQGIAEKQAASSQQNVNAQTLANRPDINTSFGSQGWTQGADGRWQMSASLNPQLQGLQSGFQNQLSGAAGADANRRASDAAYQQETSRLNPMWTQQQQSLNASLANQGLDAGSEGYQNQMGAFGRDRNDAYQGAINNSIGLGNQAQQMNFNQGMQGLQGLHGMMSMPGFMGAGQAQTTQYLPAAEAYLNYGLGQATNSNQNAADVGSGAGALGGAAIGAAMLSDERAKDNIQRWPLEAHPGVPVASFEYKGQPGKTHLGVIAQDVERVAPHLVAQGPDGFKRVNYMGLAGMAQGGGHNMDSTSALAYLTPEEQEALANSTSVDPQNQMFAEQMAQAQALRNQPQQPHTTGIGAALGGLAGMINTGVGQYQTNQAREGMTNNLDVQKKGYDAILAALRRRQLSQSGFQAGGQPGQYGLGVPDLNIHES